MARDRRRRSRWRSRPVLPLIHGDVVALARGLMRAPEAEWPAMAGCAFARARVAGRYRRREGRPHPRWGDGSLEAAVSGWPKGPEAGFDDARWRRAVVVVLGGARAYRHDTQFTVSGGIGSQEE